MKTRILTRKRLIFVEVQAEGSRQLRPSSRASLRTIPSLILQLEPLYISPLVVCGSGMDERMVNGGMPFGGVRGAPFIAQGGRFPPKINMETYGNRLRRIRSSFPPRLSRFGTKVGPADPVVRLAHRCRLSCRLSSWILLSGPPTCVCQCRGFVRQFSLSNGPILKVKRRMGCSVCFSLRSLVFSSHFTSGCLQIIIHQSSWNLLELSPTTKFGDQLL